ncbi:MAG: hypothetical protein JO069_05460 [Verrucomicrobia bacterium]|nr:hypothetical protein [Verrucomicrobiota bacterium]
MSVNPVGAIILPEDHQVVQAWESRRRPVILHRKGSTWYVSWKERDEDQ